MREMPYCTAVLLHYSLAYPNFPPTLPTQEPDLEGLLPLHHSAMGRAPLATVEALLHACPEAVSIEAREGWLPLSLGLVYSAPADVVGALLSAYPAAAALHSDGSVPLHLAAKHASVRVLQLVLDAHPDAARESDPGGRLPLHLAVTRTDDADQIVASLLRAFPAGVRSLDVEGLAPLHVAASSRASANVVARLLRSSSQEVRLRDLDGQLPLHLAVKHAAPVEAVVELLRHHPDGAAEHNTGGYLPLHVAEENGASSDVVALLLQSNPVAAGQRTRWGRLPLHLLLKRGIDTGEYISTRRATDGAATQVRAVATVAGRSPLWQAVRMRVGTASTSRTAAVATSSLLH